MAYAAGRKKFEPFGDVVIRAGRVSYMLPVLEAVLDLLNRPQRAAPDAAARSGPDYTREGPRSAHHLPGNVRALLLERNRYLKQAAEQELPVPAGKERSP